MFNFLILHSQNKVYVVDLKSEVNVSTARHIKNGIEAAEQDNAKLIIIHMNTYGGEVVAADSIRTALLNTKIPTAVFVDKNAASAGALISIACDKIYMASGANIGAATVVNGNNGEAMPDKYQSYMRSTMRSTAEENGRDPKIAEKMVDQNLSLPGISEKGTVITFTVSEAIEHGYCDAKVSSVEEVIKLMKVKNPEIVHYEDDMTETFIQFLMLPAVSSILVIMIFGGLFFELKSPGLGFPGLVALVGAALFFAPHYLHGLVGAWEILGFGLALILIAMEIFVVPGFGVTGISGIILLVLSLTMSFLHNKDLDFSMVTWEDFAFAIFMVAIALASSLVGIFALAKYVFKSKWTHPYVSTATFSKEDGYTAFSDDFSMLVGKKGTATTDLRPSGFIEIKGKKYDAEAQTEYISVNDEVQVVKVDTYSLIVKKI